jgi:hypothetical protein
LDCFPSPLYSCIPQPLLPRFFIPAGSAERGAPNAAQLFGFIKKFEIDANLYVPHMLEPADGFVSFFDDRAELRYEFHALAMPMNPRSVDTVYSKHLFKSGPARPTRVMKTRPPFLATSPNSSLPSSLAAPKLSRFNRAKAG